jgi:hypothetical protein
MSVMADDAPVRRQKRSALLDPQVLRFALGVALIVLILFGQQFYGMATASWRLDPSLRGAAEPRNVVVVLDFMPERFHNERVQQYGAFSGRDGALNRLRLRNVTPERLRQLAAIPWIGHIEPMK